MQMLYKKERKDKKFKFKQLKILTSQNNKLLLHKILTKSISAPRISKI